MKTNGNDLEKRVQLLEMALVRICQVATKEYKEDRPASLLEETIEQIVVVDLNIDAIESEDLYSEALEEYETALNESKEG